MLTRLSPVCSGSRARRRPSSGPDGIAAKMLLDTFEGVVALDVADDHEGGVIRLIVPMVMREKVLARHRFHILEPPNRRVSIGMCLERGGRHLLIEELIRIVLSTFQLGNDDRALRRTVVRVVQTSGHPL